MYLLSKKHFDKMRFGIDTSYLDNDTDKLYLDKYNNKNGKFT